MSAVAKQLIRQNLPPLSYIRHIGNKRPGIVYIGGFMSVKNGGKPEQLFRRYALERDYSMVLFDYTDKGESVWAEEGKEKIWSFDQWLNDALTVIDELTDGPQLLIGSSMGAWMSCIVAMQRPERVAGIVTISAAVGFTERLAANIPEEFRAKYESGALLELPGPYGSILVRKCFIEEANKRNFLKQKHDVIGIDCPMTLLHCTADDVAPYECSLELLQRVRSKNVELHLHKTGGHRMMDEHEIKIIFDHVDKTLTKL